MKTPCLNVIAEDDKEILYQSDILPDVRMEQIYGMTKEMHELSLKYEKTYQLLRGTLITGILLAIVIFSYTAYHIPKISEFRAAHDKVLGSMGKGEQIHRFNKIQDAIDDLAVNKSSTNTNNP